MTSLTLVALALSVRAGRRRTTGKAPVCVSSDGALTRPGLLGGMLLGIRSLRFFLRVCLICSPLEDKPSNSGDVGEDTYAQDDDNGRGKL